MKLWTLGMVIVLSVAAAACNTARGIGEDATAAGHAVTDTAKKLTGSKSDSGAQSAPAEGTSAAPASPAPAPDSK